jgi:hypothetical protein
MFYSNLKDQISPVKDIKANGIRFKIRPLNVLNHLQGFNVLVETYATYERKKDQKQATVTDIQHALSKVKEVYRDIFLASVIEPKLVSKKDEAGQFVDDLFDDWDLCHSLYEAIMAYTNKKKMKNSTSLNRGFLN